MEKILSNMNFTEILNALTIGLSVIGGIVALFQWSDSNKLKRAEYVNNLFKEL